MPKKDFVINSGIKVGNVFSAIDDVVVAKEREIYPNSKLVTLQSHPNEFNYGISTFNANENNFNGIVVNIKENGTPIQLFSEATSNKIKYRNYKETSEITDWPIDSNSITYPDGVFSDQIGGYFNNNFALDNDIWYYSQYWKGFITNNNNIIISEFFKDSNYEGLQSNFEITNELDSTEVGDFEIRLKLSDINLDTNYTYYGSGVWGDDPNLNLAFSGLSFYTYVSDGTYVKSYKDFTVAAANHPELGDVWGVFANRTSGPLKDTLMDADVFIPRTTNYGTIRIRRTNRVLYTEYSIENDANGSPIWIDIGYNDTTNNNGAICCIGILSCGGATQQTTFNEFKLTAENICQISLLYNIYVYKNAIGNAATPEGWTDWTYLDLNSFLNDNVELNGEYQFNKGINLNGSITLNRAENKYYDLSSAGWEDGINYYKNCVIGDNFTSIGNKDGNYFSIKFDDEQFLQIATDDISKDVFIRTYTPGLISENDAFKHEVFSEYTSYSVYRELIDVNGENRSAWVLESNPPIVAQLIGPTYTKDDIDISFNIGYLDHTIPYRVTIKLDDTYLSSQKSLQIIGTNDGWKMVYVDYYGVKTTSNILPRQNLNEDELVTVRIQISSPYFSGYINDVLIHQFNSVGIYNDTKFIIEYENLNYSNTAYSYLKLYNFYFKNNNSNAKIKNLNPGWSDWVNLTNSKTKWIENFNDAINDGLDIHNKVTFRNINGYKNKTRDISTHSLHSTNIRTPGRGYISSNNANGISAFPDSGNITGPNKGFNKINNGGNIINLKYGINKINQLLLSNDNRLFIRNLTSNDNVDLYYNFEENFENEIELRKRFYPKDFYELDDNILKSRITNNSYRFRYYFEKEFSIEFDLYYKDYLSDVNHNTSGLQIESNYMMSDNTENVDIDNLYSTPGSPAVTYYAYKLNETQWLISYYIDNFLLCDEAFLSNKTIIVDLDEDTIKLKFRSYNNESSFYWGPGSGEAINEIETVPNIVNNVYYGNLNDAFGGYFSATLYLNNLDTVLKRKSIGFKSFKAYDVKGGFENNGPGERFPVQSETKILHYGDWREVGDIPWININSDTILTRNSKLLIDADNLTITLPSNPLNGEIVELLDTTGTISSNPLTVNSNGKKINGVIQNIIINTNYSHTKFVYNTTNDTWIKF